MANEILKDEQLTEEQLDGVAGGTIEELDKDVTFLRDIGLMPKIDPNASVSVCIDPNGIASIFADAGVRVSYHPEGSNEYSINGKQITRKQAMQHVLDVKHMRMNLDKYM